MSKRQGTEFRPSLEALEDRLLMTAAPLPHLAKQAKSVAPPLQSFRTGSVGLAVAHPTAAALLNQRTSVEAKAAAAAAAAHAAALASQTSSIHNPNNPGPGVSIAGVNVPNFTAAAPAAATSNTTPTPTNPNLTSNGTPWWMFQ